MIQTLKNWFAAKLSGKARPKDGSGPRPVSLDGIRPTDQELDLIKKLSDSHALPQKKMVQPGIIFSGLKSKLSSEELISRVSKEIDLEGLDHGRNKLDPKGTEMSQSRPLTELESKTETGL